MIEEQAGISTIDGVIISVQNNGLRHAAPEVMARLNQGEVVDPSLVYFRSVPTFEAPTGPYDWLNRHIFVANLARMPDHVVMDVFQVL